MVKNPPANAGDSGSIPGLGRSPREGNGRPPTPVLLPGESHGRRSLAGCSPWGRESRTRPSTRIAVCACSPPAPSLSRLCPPRFCFSNHKFLFQHLHLCFCFVSKFICIIKKIGPHVSAMSCGVCLCLTQCDHLWVPSRCCRWRCFVFLVAESCFAFLKNVLISVHLQIVSSLNSISSRQHARPKGTQISVLSPV